MANHSPLCEKCGNESRRSRYCAAQICTKCRHHNGLVRCYCGWSSTPGSNGRVELENLGEVIGDMDEEFYYD